LDNGWEKGGGDGVFQLNTGNGANAYPQEAAASNGASLKLLSNRIKSRGWFGLGFWVTSADDTPEWVQHFKDAAEGMCSRYRSRGRW
jgi:hypothetical protein